MKQAHWHCRPLVGGCARKCTQDSQKDTIILCSHVKQHIKQTLREETRLLRTAAGVYLPTSPAEDSLNIYVLLDFGLVTHTNNTIQICKIVWISMCKYDLQKYNLT